MFQFSKKRFIMMRIGNLVMGIGIALFKVSIMGNDPSTALVIAIADQISIDFSLVLIVVNSLYFAAEIIWGRKMIGVGTFINWFGIGFIASFFAKYVNGIIGTEPELTARVLCLIIGVLILSFGCSLYQTADLGISPYDSVSLMMDEHLPMPYFVCRIITDALCAFGAYMLGGIIGFGTLICAFGLGPFISFFNRTVSEPMLGDGKF